MEFKNAWDDPAEELDFDEFVALVRSGVVGPTAWYRTPWSRGWRTVDNYPPFHRHSPLRYPVGELLAKERREEAAHQQQAHEHRTKTRSAAELIRRLAAPHSLQQIIKTRSDVVGASRLSIRPCFEPERIVTLLFKFSSIEVNVSGPKRALHEYLPHEEVHRGGDGRNVVTHVSGRPLSASEVDHEAGGILYDNAPEWIESWEAFRSYTFPLESCQNLVMDGVGYTHEICGSGCDKTVDWSNPSWRENPQQMIVIRAYVETAEAAGLKRLIRMWRGWWDR